MKAKLLKERIKTDKQRPDIVVAFQKFMKYALNKDKPKK